MARPLYVINSTALSVPHACQFIRERHTYWCGLLTLWARLQGHELKKGSPKCAIKVRAMQACGKYFPLGHVCEYRLPYAMVEPDYDTTIAHEVVHAFQRQIFPDCHWHGDFFKYLLGYVCECPIEITHSYSVERAKKVSRVIQEWKRLHQQTPWKEVTECPAT